MDLDSLRFEYFRLGMSYFISGRFAQNANLLPVTGNLFHHAIEMFLKAFRAGTRAIGMPSQGRALIPCGGHAPCSHDGTKEPHNLIEKHRAHSRPAPRIHSAATCRGEARWRPAGRAGNCWHRITDGGFWAAAANAEPGVGDPRFAFHRGGSRWGRSATRLEHRVYRTVDRRIRLASQKPSTRGVAAVSALTPMARLEVASVVLVYRRFRNCPTRLKALKRRSARAGGPPLRAHLFMIDVRELVAKQGFERVDVRYKTRPRKPSIRSGDARRPSSDAYLATARSSESCALAPTFLSRRTFA